MKVQTLSIKSFRGIREDEMAFDEHLNVFVGANGCGKSSVLQALSYLLSSLTSRILDASPKPIPEAAINNLSHFSELTIGCDSAEWTMVRNRPGTVAERKSDFEGLKAYVNKLKQAYTENRDGMNWPVIAYYPTTRTELDIPQRIRNQHDFTSLQTYNAGSLSVDFRLFFEWFRQRQEEENNHRISLYEEGMQAEAGKYEDRGLKTIRNALKPFFPGFTTMKVRSNPLRLELTKGDEVLSFQQLSDGEKAFISLISDIAFRFYLANPTLEDPLQGEGVVLIDELDMHLHPKWQVDVVPNLEEAFPHCQFFVTTHSPLILNRVDNGKVFLMRESSDGIKSVDASQTYGYLPESILVDHMGLDFDSLRPKRVNSILSNIYQLIGANRLEEAETAIAEAEKLLPGEHELVRARMLVKRKRIIGK